MKKEPIYITIEIPKGSQIKYEYDRKTGKVLVDRILYGPSAYPQNYGFIENTLDWDGDELDALVIANQSFNTGVLVPVRILGAMEMIDDGETDTKLITVIDCDPRFKEYESINDLPQHMLAEIKDFFETYKRLQKKPVEVRGFKDATWALKELEECKELFNNYSNIAKDEFIAKMKAKHPEKYGK